MTSRHGCKCKKTKYSLTQQSGPPTMGIGVGFPLGPMVEVCVFCATLATREAEMEMGVGWAEGDTLDDRYCRS